MNVEKILDKFPEDMKSRFVNLSSSLEENESASGFEEDVAVLILDLMDRTASYESDIMQTSFLIANAFKDYDFSERISNALSLFCELQIPTEFQEGREFKMWNRAREYLITALDEEDLD